MHVEMCDTEAAKDDSLRNNCCKIMSVYCDKKASGGGGSQYMFNIQSNFWFELSNQFFTGVKLLVLQKSHCLFFSKWMSQPSN